MRRVAIVQARMGSTRLPGKIAKTILGEPMLMRMLERVKRAKKLDAILVATSDKAEDDVTSEIARKAGVAVFRGSEKDVLDRYYRAAQEAGAEVVMRLTGDCALMDPEVIDQVATHFEEVQADYTSTPSNYPEGLDTEIFTFATLKEAAQKAILPSEREHVTLYIRNHPERFKIDAWEKGEQDYSHLHWSVDTTADFEFVTKIYEKLYPSDSRFTMDDVLQLLREQPELQDINKGGTGFEGLEKSLQEDEQHEPKR